MRCGFLSLLFASLTVWISSVSACLGADPLEGLDDFINQAMAKHEVPGLAIAIVKEGQVVVAKGYGVRELGKPEPVDADTIFAIGSCTKAFTTTAIGLLVDEGKMKWDDKVIDHFPEFKLYDPYVTREITIRDLLTHRCGLDRHDVIWVRSPHSRTEVLRRIALAKPDSSFRSKFSYNNIMYLAAGEAAGRAAGGEWETLIAERLFKPLGMTRSTTSIRTLTEHTDVATPHERVHDVVAPIPWLNIDNIAPAGAINSSVNDMAKWIQFQLNGGSVGGQRILSTAALQQTRTPQITMPLSGLDAKLFPDARVMTYGMGWMIHQENSGGLRLEHSGAIDGMSSNVVLLPESKLGLVVLTNSRNFLVEAISNHVVDRFLAKPSRDWSEILLGIEKLQREMPMKWTPEAAQPAEPG